MSVGEILDGAFTLYRRHFSAFFGASLIPQLPLAGVWIVFMLVAGVSGMSPTTEAAVYGGFAVLALPLSLVATVLPFGALVRMAGDAYLGNPVSQSEGLRWGWRRFGTVWALSLVAGLAVVLGLLLLIVPGVLAAIVLAVAIPVAMLEQRGYVEAQRRSRALARGGWGQIFAVLMVLLVIGMLPTVGIELVVTLVVGSVSSAATAGAIWEAAKQVLGVLVGSLTLPVTMIATTLLYYDRRVRVEAFGLDPDGNMPLATA
jgi:hypothetical protein